MIGTVMIPPITTTTRLPKTLPVGITGIAIRNTTVPAMGMKRIAKRYFFVLSRRIPITTAETEPIRTKSAARMEI